jgi:hypothetical protein
MCRRVSRPAEAENPTGNLKLKHVKQRRFYQMIRRIKAVTKMFSTETGSMYFHPSRIS